MGKPHQEDPPTHRCVLGDRQCYGQSVGVVTPHHSETQNPLPCERGGLHLLLGLYLTSQGVLLRLVVALAQNNLGSPAAVPNQRNTSQNWETTLPFGHHRSWHACPPRGDSTVQSAPAPSAMGPQGQKAWIPPPTSCGWRLHQARPRRDEMAEAEMGSTPPLGVGVAQSTWGFPLWLCPQHSNGDGIITK